MNDVNHIKTRDDLISEATDLLLEQFKNKEIFFKLTYVIATMKQYLYNVTASLGLIRTIDNATGVFLDNIGEELGVPRLTEDDDSYRLLLKIRAYRVRSSATRPEIIDLLARFTGTPSNTVRTYVGDYKTVDLAFYPNCIDPYASVEELIKILPLVTNYRLIALEGRPLGFSSIHDSPNKEYNFSPIVGSIYDVYGANGQAGHVSSLISSSI
jgi:hypothetical protein